MSRWWRRRRARAASGGAHGLGLAGTAVARSTGARRSRADDFAAAEAKFREAISARLQAQRRLLATGGDPLRQEEVRAGGRAAAPRARPGRHRRARAARPDALQDVDPAAGRGGAAARGRGRQAARLVRGAAAARAAPASRPSPSAPPRRSRSTSSIVRRRRPSLDPQIHMLLGTALRLRQGLGRGAARVRGAAQDQAQRHDRQADARLGARRQERLQPGHLALRAHPRRGAEAAEHLLQPRHLLPAREARRRRAARGRALHQGQADRTPRATCSCATRSTSRRTSSARSTECQAAERLDQVNGAIKGKIGRIYLGTKNYQSAVTYLEQAVAGAKARARARIPRCWARSPRPTRRCNAPRDKLQLDRRRAGVADARIRRRRRRRGRSTSSPATTSARRRRCNASLALEPNNASARAGLVKVLNRRAGIAVEKDEVGTAYSSCCPRRSS